MRHTCVVFSLLIAALVLARPADGQVKFGVQGAIITSVDEAQDLDFNGTTGLGARVALQPPMLPIGAVAQGVYYFPEGDLDYLTYSLAAQLRLPLPVVSPYAIGGWQWRRTSVEGFDAETENGPMIGIGVQLDLAVSLFLEASMEFNDEDEIDPDFDNDPIVIKGGVLFGG